MGHLGGILTGALALVSLAGLTGLGLLRGVVTNLREQLKDARDEVAAARVTREEAKGQIIQLKADIEALGRVVRHEAEWVALGNQLDEHHAEMNERWDSAMELLTKMLQAMSE